MVRRFVKRSEINNLFRKELSEAGSIAVLRRFSKKKKYQVYLRLMKDFLSFNELGFFRKFLPKLRYRCLCLWFSRLPFVFLRRKVRSIIVGWSVSMKNRVGRCCRNPLWCGNVDRGLDLLSDRGFDNSEDALGDGMDAALGDLIRTRMRRLRVNQSISRNAFVGFNGFLLPYGSDLVANPAFKNYMRFSQRFLDTGTKSEKVADWLRLGLYRRVRFESFKANIRTQFMVRNLGIRLASGSRSLSLSSLLRADFYTWLAFYLRKRWWRPGVFT